MKYSFIICTLLLSFVSTHSFSQKKNKKNKEFVAPTQAQLENYKMYYKKLLADSVNIPLPKRDTVTSIEMAALLKRMKVNSDKSISKDDKEIQTGMLDDDMYMHLGAILSLDELERLKDFEKRQKAAADATDKERKDQENQRNSQSNTGGYRRYGGYGGYRGGYGY